MDIKAISINVGKALLVSALFMALSIGVSLFHGRDSGFGPLMISFVITLIVGAFPFIFVVSALSEIVADTSVWQQILYFTPALTVLGIAASVAMRRCGYGKHSLWIQLVGPILFVLMIGSL